MEFNNLNWHDSVIKNIIIDRNNPGKNDIIQLEMVWPNGTSNIITFRDVYWANLDMNFGIVSTESVFKAHSEGRDNEIEKSLYLKWKNKINDVDLRYYEIETASTCSKIKIIAEQFQIE